MTSVWGVLLSVAFNFIEKILEQIIRKICKTVLTGCSLD
ncbi:Restin-like protein [Vibrio cholerae]|nr:Restin-like protein [Vibrio cholerae]